MKINRTSNHKKSHNDFSLGLFLLSLKFIFTHYLAQRQHVKYAKTLIALIAASVFTLLTTSFTLVGAIANAATLQTVPLQIGLYIVQAEVAANTESRANGLMHRTEMAVNKGMLFIFERPGVQCFWMKNTFLPITAAFLNDQGKIVNMADMTPQTETPHCSKEPVRYVLEMNQGWFATRGINDGAVIKGIP